MEFDLTPFIIEAIIINERSYKYIDAIYKNNIDLYDKLASESKYLKSKLFKDGSIIQEIYFKKLVGIFQDATVLFQLIKMVEKEWKYSKTYLKNNPGDLDLSKFGIYLNRKYPNLNIEYFNSYIYITIFLALATNRSIIKDKGFEGLCRTIDLREKQYSNIRYEDIDKETLKKLKLKFTELKKKFNFNEIAIAELPFDMNGLLETNKFTNLEYFAAAYEYIYDSLGVSISKICKDDILTEKEIIELLYSYYYLEPIENDLYLQIWLTGAIQIKTLIKSYQKTKVFIRDNYAEELKEQVLKIKLINSSLEKNIKNIKGTNITLEKENELLKKENEILKNNLKEQDFNKQELISLRNYIFNDKCSSDEYLDDIILNNIKLEKLNNKQDVIIGGHPNWQNKIKKHLSLWTFISLNNINFDKRILNNKNIFINTDHLNHAIYYKIISYNNFKSITYLSNTTNVNLSLQQLDLYSK